LKHEETERKKERIKEVKNEVKKEGMKVKVAKKAIFYYKEA